MIQQQREKAGISLRYPGKFALKSIFKKKKNYFTLPLSPGNNGGVN